MANNKLEQVLSEITFVRNSIAELSADLKSTQDEIDALHVGFGEAVSQYRREDVLDSREAEYASKELKKLTKRKNELEQEKEAAQKNLVMLLDQSKRLKLSEEQ